MYLYHPSLPTPFAPLIKNNQENISDWEEINRLRTSRPDLLVVPECPPNIYQEGIFYLTYFAKAIKLLKVADNRDHIYNPLAKIFVVTLVGDRADVLQDDRNNPSRSFLHGERLRARVVIPEILLGEDWITAFSSLRLIQRKDPSLEKQENLIPQIIKKDFPISTFLSEQSPLPDNIQMSLANIANILLALLPVSRIVNHYDGGSYVSINWNSEEGIHLKQPTLNLIAAISRRAMDTRSSDLSDLSKFLIANDTDLINLIQAITSIEANNPNNPRQIRRNTDLENISSEEWFTYLNKLAQHIERNPNELTRFMDLADKILNIELRTYFLDKFITRKRS